MGWGGNGEGGEGKRKGRRGGKVSLLGIKPRPPNGCTMSNRCIETYEYGHPLTGPRRLPLLAAPAPCSLLPAPSSSPLPSHPHSSPPLPSSLLQGRHSSFLDSLPKLLGPRPKSRNPVRRHGCPFGRPNGAELAKMGIWKTTPVSPISSRGATTHFWRWSRTRIEVRRT